MDGDVSLGSWIKHQRSVHDLTQEELAERISCSVSTIRKIESDERRPSKQLAADLARGFGLTGDAAREFTQWARSREGTRPSGLNGASDGGGRGHTRRPTNLPTSPTSFVGRVREVSTVEALLRRADVRLLTLIGPPGIGKTRLAVQAAAGLRNAFLDGVWFVPLAALRDPRLIAPLVARTLGIKEVSGTSLRASLQDHLATRQALLVLDNFEQLASAAPLITDWLTGAPDIKILVTSRAALDVYGEHEFPVPLLALPDPQDTVDLDRLLQYEAVHLFVERAQAVRPDFALTAENAALVATICRRLEGLPLTIELAAARMRVFPLPALLARLQSRLTLLTGGARDLPPRQQTLRGALEWSYELLEPEEQRLFHRLAIFMQGFTVEAAEAVAGPDAADGAGVLAGLTSLVAKSLVQQQVSNDGESRYAMLETVREYAREQLVASGDLPTVARRHALYYLALAETAAPGLTGRHQAAWLRRLDREHDNLRTALAWAVEEPDLTPALRLAVALARFWEVHGPVSEGRSWLEGALVGDRGVPAELRARALHAAGNLAFDEDDYATAQTWHEESLALRRAEGNRAGIADALDSLGNVAHRQGHAARAQECVAESLALRRAINDRAGVGRTLVNLGALALGQGQYGPAREAFDEALRYMRLSGDAWGTALALNHLGEVLLYEGEYARAAALLDESLQLFRQLGDKRHSARALESLGMLARKQTDYARGGPFYTEGLLLFAEAGAKYGVAVCLEGLAAVSGGQGDPVRAACLRGAAESIRAEIGAPRPPERRTDVERRVSAARVEPDRQLIADAAAEGRALAIDEAITYALGGAPGLPVHLPAAFPDGLWGTPADLGPPDSRRSWGTQQHPF